MNFRLHIVFVNICISLNVNDPLFNISIVLVTNAERGSSALERWTRQSNEPGSSPFATVSKFEGFCSLHGATVHSAVEKSSWCRNEQVCQGVKCNNFERSNGLDSALYIKHP